MLTAGGRRIALGENVCSSQDESAAEVKLNLCVVDFEIDFMLKQQILRHNSRVRHQVYYAHAFECHALTLALPLSIPPPQER
ncbi:hypothetical protein EVAR_75531_1 [Eumeta japonica]|uniref:Uncharacterized protein n=1 Tax=Eumeta variegata TaxID=151549 RepID=A0A4C1UJ97_EUMVA|nr:hypothetical protein EVAR_75531_1 [Eumeta japonica]